jgi:hypothetical protein
MSLWGFGATTDAVGRALLLAEGLRRGPPGWDVKGGPFGVRFGICGVGLFSRSANNVLPSLFINSGTTLHELAEQPLAEFPGAREALYRVFQDSPELLKADILAVPVSPTFSQISSGDLVSVNGIRGQLGAPVKWQTSSGYLTAGHVGQSNKLVVHDHLMSSIGTVVYVLDPLSSPTLSNGVDVAVIELNQGMTHGAPPAITATAIPTANAAVDVYTQSGVRSAQIYGSAAWWYAASSKVTYTDVYLSGTGVTKGGDSGGPVLLSGNPTHIIGHVVCGGSATSCFQDVDHQLAAIRNNPSFSTIGL